ncbi:FtsX-like permease family protein [Massilia sp. TWR1-2-2]|uniref:FtsX-like permease family protein n=1 Tax=Massilia sp. TWR1-2-2 TaxID=2804584 RepID=UPI003CED9A88
MNFRHFRAGWRSLLAEPAYSLVVVFGLATGVAACLLLLGLVRYSWEYNAHVPDAAQVYVVKHRNNVEAAAPWYDQAPLSLRLAAAKLPGVAASTSYLPSRPQGRTDGKLTVRVNHQLQQLDSLTVAPGFADMLGLQALHGSVQAALERPDSFAITEAAAIRLFGSASALGRTMLVEGKLLRVGAVLRTPPANTTIPFESVIGLGSVLVDENFRHQVLTGEEGWAAKVLIRVRPGASLASITAALQQAADRSPAVQNIEPAARQKLGARRAMDIALSPLRDAYFDNGVSGNFVAAAAERASAAVVAGLGAVGILILALAALNYVNLATVRVLRRQREVAMRKVLGAGVRQIVLHFLAESMVVSAVATGLGLLLAWLALPLFSQLMNRQLEGMVSSGNIGTALAIGALLGALTAIYPVWVAVRVRPNQVLAGRPDGESTGGKQLRRLMTVLQVSAAMALASVTVAIAWQTTFAMNASPGFDPSMLLIVDLPEAGEPADKARNNSFIAALSNQPGVAGIAISEDAIGRNDMSWSRAMQRLEGPAAPIEMKTVSANFFEQYRIKPESGRLFDPAVDKDDDAVPLVLNAIAARELGFASPAAAVGQTVLFTGFDKKSVRKTVVGIAPELRFRSLREAPRAAAYELSTRWTTTLSVRAALSMPQTERIVQSLWARHYPDSILKTRRAGDIFADTYADEARIARLLAVATAIALVIAALGTYVMAAYTVQRRAKEIALRKLFGAGRHDVGVLVVREIGGLTAISAVIALPLAAVAIHRYLSTYVEHAPIGYWPLLLALASTLAVALIAVARHAWIAMRTMPSDALSV